MSNQFKNDLEKYFHLNEDKFIYKLNNYFEVYDKHFSRYRNKQVNILEIGVAHGGSLQMWKSYFGPQAKIFGVDVNVNCKKLEEENIKIFIGSQSDRNFLRELKKQIPKVDIIIEDGGHMMSQQIISFEELYDHVKEDGVYLCEDIFTSYWLNYGGGVKRRGTFIEYSKNFIDWLHAYHSKQSIYKPNNFTLSTQSIHFYDGIVVLEKGKHEKTFPVKSGNYTLETDETGLIRGSGEIKAEKLTKRFITFINIFLRLFKLKSYKWY
jgi:hypothetical protein